ncbi:MAG TPA: hypothetical protein DD490_33920 [Acidobacteria bacterium]|nr:hypothetical protein [Acidobacteriota bacterium]
MKSEVDALLSALTEKGCEGARERMPGVLAALGKPLDATATRRLLDELRSQRCFAPMKTFAAAAVSLAEDGLLVYVKRQLAQALIELGDLGDAIRLLEDLIQGLAAKGTPRDRSEVLGLLGRARKQRFVEAVNGGAKGQNELRAAVDAYTKGFAVGWDPSWHGANLVALAARAEREGFSPGTDSAAAWARCVLDQLAEKPQVRWEPWDFAAAGEAYLALGDEKNIAGHFASYWNLSNADAFALAGTERQLREIWQFSDDSPDSLPSSLVLHLAARKLLAAKGAASYSPGDLKALAARLPGISQRAEATFGPGSSIPVTQVQRLLACARSVCRIVDSSSGKSGTGFLVRGADLNPPQEGVVVLTNHHVLHGDETPAALLETEDYKGAIHARWARAEFHFWKGESRTRTFRIGAILDSSVRSEKDFTVASLVGKIKEDLALPLSHSLKPLGSRNFVDPSQRAKVFLIGHPHGDRLSFSLSDNEVVDHELDDQPRERPRRIHYRTPTERGSSGSPVLHHETLEVIGLHRTGRATPLREDWPRAAPGAVYEANEAVAVRSLLGL